MRVLLLAEDCNPDWPSLPVVAYKYARALAEVADVTLITQIRNKPNIERDGCGKAKVIFLDTEAFAAPLYKLTMALRGGQETGWTINTAMGYLSTLYFEWAAWKKLRPRFIKGEYDIIHRISPMSPTQPSLLSTLSPIPFILGPLNGGLPWSKLFREELNREREWLSHLRNVFRWLPYVQATYRKSKVILAAFKHTIADLPVSTRSKTINFPEVGFDPKIFWAPDRPQRKQMTILFAGRLVPYKLPEVVVRAFAASATLRQHRLIVVGSGPESTRLEQIIIENQLQDCVSLVGRKTQAEVGELMRQAEIFAFPSIRELGAGVVIEAMASGMAPIVVDYGGPADLVQPGCGIKIPMGKLGYLVQQFTLELERMVNQPDEVAAFGKAAHQHAMEFYTWEAKAKQTLALYQQVASKTKLRTELLSLPIPIPRQKITL
jgi:glycosyltransferase involved in cell wall biosynthesis